MASLRWNRCTVSAPMHAGFPFIRLLILKCGCLQRLEAAMSPNTSETRCRVLTRPPGRRRLSPQLQLIVERQRSLPVLLISGTRFHPQVLQSEDFLYSVWLELNYTVSYYLEIYFFASNKYFLSSWINLFFFWHILLCAMASPLTVCNNKVN